ncbi:pilus assembly protein [Pseudoxanthomonas japonensis]|nr:pilus assembly protein [Pseudoxanthomonas japonensis]
MNIPNNKPRGNRKGSHGGRLLPMLLACAATLVSLPGGAITVPDVPLQSGRPYPPPNMMFILDDSGSMNFIAMPHDVADPWDPQRDDYGVRIGLRDNLADKSYINNSIYYNPAVTYNAWMGANRSRYTGGTTYGSAYWNPSALTDAIDLGEQVQTFFVPKNPATATTATGLGDYYRFQILTDGRIIRSAVGNRNDANGVADSGCGNNRNGGYDSTNDVYWRACTVANPTTGRDAAAEKSNYATWYSYHRTRMKVAKAGASEAFAQLESNIRVGLDTLNRNISGLPYYIPVDSSGGRFEGANKTTWFTYLQSATGGGNTPLRRALHRAGQYFSGLATDAPDPMGPVVEGSMLSCRQNFTILTTDGYWNSDSGFNAVGDADGTAGPTVTGPNDKSYTYAVASPYRDNYATSPGSRANTLADIAMYYWKRDLRDLENDVPDSDDDPAFWQHMVTFGVSIGQKGTLNPTQATLDAIANGSTRWPDPISNSGAQRIDDLWHAAVNGRGDFIVANNTQNFVQGLQDAINTMAKRQGSASNVTANSTSFVSDTRVYQAKYMSGSWTGELSAYDATAAGVARNPAWEASRQFPVWSSRSVFTWTGTQGSTFPTSDQVTLLNQSSRLVAPVNGTDNANYIKGDASRERKNTNGTLRNRDVLLGDIVNSSPMYVKDSETIFVGANDGMLHAFSAISVGSGNNAIPGGRELFAYVPAGVNFTDLASLSNPNYQHKYFVDGPIVVSTRAQTGGRNYLVGALGRGGKGLFGLDVTDPARFRATDVKWELTSGTHMGNVLGEPLIVTLNDTNHTKAIVVGNGINSTSGNAVLFVINIATGAVIQTIDTGVSGDNGMAAPRGWDENGDGTVDYIYAGDMRGNLWKFDFTGATASIAFSGQPMFTTASGQPITTGLALAREPQSGRRWVFVGTGSFISEDDVDNTTTQSVYALIDSSSEPIGRDDLISRDIVVTGTMNGSVVRGFETHGGLVDTAKGWYLNLGTPTAGERVVSRPAILGKVLIFSSIIPPQDDNPCAAGGSGFLNAIDAFTGTSTSKTFFDANNDGTVNSSDQIANGNTRLPVGSFDPGVGMPTLPTVIDKLMVVGGSKGTLNDTAIDPDMGAPRRVSWREIVRD